MCSFSWILVCMVECVQGPEGVFVCVRVGV